MKFLVRLYPARWRRRYGAELEQLLDDLGPASYPARASTAVDLLRGAARAHLTWERTMDVTFKAAIRRGVLIALLVWVVLSAEVVRANVLFPSRADNDGVSVVFAYFGAFAALAAVGVVAQRTGVDLRRVVWVGVIAGVLVGALTIGTFFAVDNVFLDTVSQQQTKIDGLARSGMSSMREYINRGLLGALPFLTVFFGFAGAVLSAAGATAARRFRSGAPDLG